ncbi:Protein of unknown function [Micromonospora citrea]|uniref:DUF3068 domain-containing protein n=1 Tax=Micromonospora citrea TaxID=47855 RepID=A0A1C6V5Y2_9ACTN|nr:DUF3068 domain-containing protein [Micromonospora citrea]SCL61688.1 Protein of unknown function [Micromonospora citrea]
MKHRAIGAVLFGGGILLLALAAGLVLVVKPAVAKLPYDLEASTSVAEAKGATFLQITNGNIAINRADLKSTIRVSPDAKTTDDLSGDLDGKAVVWQVGQTVERTDTKELVSAYGLALALDRVSGAAVEWNDQYLDDTGTREKVQFSGQMYKFPFGAEKKTYQIYDRDVRDVRPAEFKGTEVIKGIESYRYEQVITEEPQKLAEERVKLLLGALAPGASTGKVLYSNTRTVWIDPVTGVFLKVREVQRKTLVPDVGAPTTLLDADFSYNDETITASAKRAEDNRQKLSIVGVYVPIGLALLGLVLAAAGLLVARRGAASAVEARHRADADSTPTWTDQPAAYDTAEQPTVANPAVPGQRPATGEVERR